MLKVIIYSYLLTVFIEIISLIFLKEKKSSIYFYSILVNAVTNIPLNIVFYLFFKDVNIYYYILLIIVFEGMVVFIEYLLYLIVLKQKKLAFKYSLILNASSYFIGLAIQLIINYINM